MRNKIKVNFFNLFKKKNKQLKLGLALGSGGAKGLAHIGALKAFEENGIEFSVVAGTSIGSIVGAFYAKGYTSDEIMHLLETVDFKEITNLLMVKMDTLRLEDVLNRYIGDLEFNELKKPFMAVATNQRTGEEFDISSGSVAKALCASSSYPPFFKAVEINGEYYIDGAFTNAIPADLVKQMGADFVVGIDLSAFKKESKLSFLGDILTNVRFDKKEGTEKGYKNADVMLKPDLGNYSPLSFNAFYEMYEIGYNTALNAIPEIKNKIELLKKGK